MGCLLNTLQLVGMVQRSAGKCRELQDLFPAGIGKSRPFCWNPCNTFQGCWVFTMPSAEFLVQLCRELQDLFSDGVGLPPCRHQNPEPIP